MNETSQWWASKYGLERACDCRKGNRGAECADGWHLVGSSDDLEEVRREVRQLAPHGIYRTIEISTRRVA